MPPESALGQVLQRVGPTAEFLRLQEGIDEQLFDLIDERRAEPEGERDDVLAMLLAAATRTARRCPARRSATSCSLLVADHEHGLLAELRLRAPASPPGRAPAALRERSTRTTATPISTATIHEVLRRRPVLPNSAPRLVVEPIESGSWSYPTGVCLVPNAYLVHHDPEIYPDPYAFRPERFLDEKPGTYTWIPFGGGRRRCIGASFAMLEMSSCSARFSAPATCALRATASGRAPPQHHDQARRGSGRSSGVAILHRW